MTDATPASSTRRWPLALVFGAYLLLAFAAAWPLTADLLASLPGAPSGDTGVYVWNLWIFRHQLIGHGTSPLWTDHILQPGPPVDLALHNYTIFQNIVGLPLVSWLGLAGAFNVVWITMQALSGLSVFLLARRYATRDRAAFVAGLFFAFSPTMVTRSTAHQSLVAAAPLAFFLLFVTRAAEHRTRRDAALAGACAAWAAICDAYYGVYCAVLLLVVMAVRVLRFERFDTVRAPARPARILSWVMVLPAAAAMAIAFTGGGTFVVFGQRIRMGTLYTPMLLLTVVAIARGALALRRRGRWRIDARPERTAMVQVLWGSAVCALLLSPLLLAAADRLRSGGELQQAVLWRSSPPGVDLSWFFVPNPNHPLAPQALRSFVMTRPDSYPENVASIPYVVILVIGLTLWRRYERPRLPLALVVCFGLLALGPFVIVAHTNTYVPGPWSVLRYVPIVGAARTPTRFVIPMLIGVALLFAWGIDRIPRRRLVFAGITAALAFELLPVPRPAVSAAIPRVYDTIAADREDVTVLELPFGIWDGTSQTGFANIGTMYFQTRHEKRLLGGYLSRVPPQRVREQMSYSPLRLFAQMSQGLPLEPNLARMAREDATSFVQRVRLRYVVIDPHLASPALRRHANELLNLRLVQTVDGLELYRTTR